MTITTDGDPKLYETGNGPEILVTDGQPAMDDGLENAAYLSLFSDEGWWGNAVSAESEKATSRLYTMDRRTLTNQARLDAEEYARQALAWMVTEGVAKKVTVTASLPSIGMLGLMILIEQPDRTSTIRYQINWATMALRVGA